MKDKNISIESNKKEISQNKKDKLTNENIIIKEEKEKEKKKE